MAERHVRRHRYWRLADLVPQERKYTDYQAVYKWAWMIGPYIVIEAGKAWTFGFCFYLFAFCICHQARPENMDSGFTGLELFWRPTHWNPSRIKPGDYIWRHSYRIGRYYSER